MLSASKIIDSLAHVAAYDACEDAIGAGMSERGEEVSSADDSVSPRMFSSLQCTFQTAVEDNC